LDKISVIKNYTMIGIFSQNRVTLNGHLIILLSESDLTYTLCDVSCYVLLSVLV